MLSFRPNLFLPSGGFCDRHRGNDGFVRKAGYAGMVDVGSDHERSKYANHCKVSG